MDKIKTTEVTSQFLKSLKNLPKNIQDTFHKKDLLFRLAPFNASHKTHRLKGKLKGLYAYSINRAYRVLFEFVNAETVIYFDVGTHEIYR